MVEEAMRAPVPMAGWNAGFRFHKRKGGKE
jgi:hypothetical protein